MSLWLLVPLLALGLTGAWFFIGPLADSRTTYAAAESAFRGLSAKMSLSPVDFQAPPLDAVGVDDRMVVLSWTSITRPGCRIEVDVDRRYANARPTWSCE